MFHPLEYGTVDIYYRSIGEEHDEDYGTIAEVLDREELLYYSRCESKKRKSEFFAGRALLKEALSCLIGKLPKDIRLLKTRHGKLYLGTGNRERAKGNIGFNLAHTNGIVVCALVLDSHIGVDIERINRKLTGVGLSFFSLPEIKYLKDCLADDRDTETCRIWTMKEAYVKARGKGLSMPFKDFSVFENDVFYFNMMLEAEYYLSIAIDKFNLVNYKVRITNVTR